jgi:predicted RNase H-like HicB family nuclease/predicted RNA binding protein YcfA (HicA-like mRNA interferase family)
MRSFRAAFWKQDNWYIAQCVEVDVATQAGSEAEALENMREALALHFDLPEAQFEVHLEPADAGPKATSHQAERSFRAVRFRLEAAGFRGISQKPNHAKFIKTNGQETITAILPHYTELSNAVLASVLRQAKMPPDEFDK